LAKKKRLRKGIVRRNHKGRLAFTYNEKWTSEDSHCSHFSSRWVLQSTDTGKIDPLLRGPLLPDNKMVPREVPSR